MIPDEVEQIHQEIEKTQYERDLRVKLALLQAAATLRATPNTYTVKEALSEARAIWLMLNE
jgi:DNA polymerase III delta prime subunit